MSCGCASTHSGGCGAYTIAPCTTRIDVTANAGEPFDLLIPILDANNDPVEIVAGAEGQWSVLAQVRRNPLATVVLHEWTTSGAAPNAQIVPGEAAQIRLTATSAETTAWQLEWPDYTNSWDLELTEPSINGGDVNRLAAGQFNLSAQHTR